MKARSPLYIGIIICGIFAACACSSMPTRETAVPAPSLTRTLVRTMPEARQEWAKGDIPKSDTELFFKGVSNPLATEALSADAARDNAFTQVLHYYGILIRSSAVEKSSLSGSTDEVLAPYLQNESEITRFAQNVVSQIAADSYYTEVWLRADNTEEYITHVLCTIPKQKAERDINEFEQKISERYSNLISIQSTLIGSINVYKDIYTSLQQNPLHRMIASYNSPQGKVSLFEYCRVQMNALSGSVSFVSIPSQKVPKGETLKTNVHLSSSLFSTIGNILCRVTISGRNNGAPAVLYTVGPENAFSLEIKTALLETGNYNVQMELLVNNGSPVALQNPSSGFSFEVTPISAVITFSGEVLTANEQKALTQAVQQAIQKYNVPLQNGYQFEVHVSIRSQTDSISGTELLLSDVSVALLQGRNVVSQSENKRITEMNRDRTVTLAGNFIRDNTAFWNEVRGMLEK